VIIFVEKNCQANLMKIHRGSFFVLPRTKPPRDAEEYRDDDRDHNECDNRETLSHQFRPQSGKFAKLDRARK
jgi:hypothetical protein